MDLRELGEFAFGQRSPMADWSARLKSTFLVLDSRLISPLAQERQASGMSMRWDLQATHCLQQCLF